MEYSLLLAILGTITVLWYSGVHFHPFPFEQRETSGEEPWRLSPAPQTPAVMKASGPSCPASS